MQCPKCGYVLTPFEVDCPRCKIFDSLVEVPPDEPEIVDEPAVSETDVPAAVSPAAALVPCPLCQRPVSPRALHCPNCGHPMMQASMKPEAVKPAAVAGEPVAVIAPIIKPAPLPPKVVPAPPLPRPLPAPVVTVSRAVPSREAFPVPAPVMRPEPPSYAEARSSRQSLVLVAAGLAAVVVALWLIIGLSRAGHNHSAGATRQLAQASQLIAQADADAAQFQQSDLTPEQAAASLQTRTTQYQEAQRLCGVALASGGDQSTGSREQQAATRGLLQAQADTEAQAARSLTAKIGESIALYKQQTLTDAQAAHVRSRLLTECRTALGQCTDALRGDPANAVAWAARVRALRFMGEAKAAGAALSRAQALSPGNPLLMAQGGAPK